MSLNNNDTNNRSCSGCKYAIYQDHGYSNYTVEGTDFYCGKKRHPEAPFDRWYGEDPRLQFAANCSDFEAGDPIEMDVEGYNYNSLTDEEKAIYDGRL